MTAPYRDPHGKTLADYITLTKSDFHGARRIVNGTDKADLIAGYAVKFDALLKAEGYGAAKPADAPKPPPREPAPQASPSPLPVNGGAVGILLGGIAAILAGAWASLAGLPCEYLNLFCG